MNALFGPRAAVMVAAVAVLCLGGAVAGEPPDVRVADFAGKILAHDEEGFDFRLDETGDVVRLRWADLAPGEVDRVRRAVVKLAAERQPAAGPLVDAVRVTLRTSKILT